MHPLRNEGRDMNHEQEFDVCMRVRVMKWYLSSSMYKHYFGFLWSVLVVVVVVFLSQVPFLPLAYVLALFR